MGQEHQRWKGIMKCYPFEEERLAKWNPPYIVQPKFDGDRCRNEPLHSGTSVLLSSEENIFYSVPHINEHLAKSGLWQFNLDGELYSHQLFLEGGHELIHSIASRSVNLHPRHKELEFWLFDLKNADLPQWKRMTMLASLKAGGPVQIAPYWLCQTLSEVKRAYDQCIDMYFEGIVIRHVANMYVEKRSIWLMKFKPKKQDTYKIIGWKEEETIDKIPKGRLGSLLLSSQSGDTFSVSAGLNDEERDRLWKVRDELPGKDAIVHYQHLTNNKIPKGCFDLEVMQ